MPDYQFTSILAAWYTPSVSRLSRRILLAEPPAPPPLSRPWLSIVLRAWDAGPPPLLPPLGIPRSGIAADNPPPGARDLSSVLLAWQGGPMPVWPRLRVPDAPLPPPNPPPTADDALNSILSAWFTPVLARLSRSILLASGPPPSPPPPTSTSALTTVLAAWATPQLARLSRTILLASGVAPPSPPPPFTRSSLELSVWTNYETWIDFTPSVQILEPPLPPTPTSGAWLPILLRAWDPGPMPVLPVWGIPVSGIAPSFPPPLIRAGIEWLAWTNYEAWIDLVQTTQAIEPPLPPPTSPNGLASILTAWHTPVLARLSRAVLLTSGIAPSNPPPSSTAVLNAILNTWWTVFLFTPVPTYPFTPTGPPPPAGPSDIYIPPWRPRRRR